MSNIDEEIEITTSIEHKQTEKKEEATKNKFEQAVYNFETTKHIYSKYLGNENGYVLTITPLELEKLSNNTQNNLESIKKVNRIVKQYINKDDLTGKVYESIENNVNSQVKLSFANIEGRNKQKIKSNTENIIKDFNKKIDLEKFIKKGTTTTFSEGNFVTYLRDLDNGYVIDVYPLGIVEVSPYNIDGEPILLLNMDELKTRLSTNVDLFKNLKAKNPFSKTVEEEIKKNYPPEVQEAYRLKDKYAILDSKRTHICRINNLNGLYGLTPIFKSLPAQLMLETIDNVDRKNTIAKGKKIISQILRKELLGDKGENTEHFEEISYAHGNLVTGLSQQTVVVTSPAYVEKIEIIESKAEPTKIETITYYRNKVLNSLGISFLSNESKSSYTAVAVNVDELLKTINKITEQLSAVLNKYYKVICELNKIDLSYCPSVTIQDSQLLDNEAKMKLVELLYSKVGASYQTVFEVLNMGINAEDEAIRRKEENELGYDETFSPHPTSFVISGIDSKNTDKKEENQNINTEQQTQNKDRYQNDLKNIK